MKELSETIIFQNILAKTKKLSFPPSFYFWRDYSEHEIDLIAEKGERIIPIEITISKDIKSNKLRNFSFFFNMYPDIKNGILLYGGDDVKEIGTNGHTIFAIPLWLWW